MGPENIAASLNWATQRIIKMIFYHGCGNLQLILITMSFILKAPLQIPYLSGIA